MSGEGEARILSLFESPGSVETPTPGAAVWLARDPASARPVLIKRLPGNQARRRATEALLLKHPHLVPARRWMIEEDRIYVVRDVIRGKNLKQHLAAARQSTFPSAEALRRLFLPLLSALEAVHGEQSAHGGISPENILIDEEGRPLLCDFGTALPDDPRHLPHYRGVASADGDIRAMAKLIVALLPTTGSFSIGAVRGRIEGIARRCDTVGDVREMLDTLEKLSVVPIPRPLGTPIPVPPRPARLQVLTGTRAEPVTQGGGGTAVLELRNDGETNLVIRMIATQHAWLNVRPVALPLTLVPGGTARVEFALSAARLSPGAYRCDIYFSSNDPEGEALRSGWFKQSVTMHITVVAGGGRAFRLK